MRTLPRQLAAVSLLAALVFGGCRDPYQPQSKPVSHSRDAARAIPTTVPNDTAGPGGPPPPAPYLPPSHRSAVRTAAATFARRWINWDWQAAAAQQRELANLAAGQLAAQLRSSARVSVTDGSLARDKPSSRGEVVAVDLKQNRGTAAGLVVTREQSYTDAHADLGGAHYRVYLTALERIAGRWGITRWEPQP
jgi:hypothetical protein